MHVRKPVEKRRELLRKAEKKSPEESLYDAKFSVSLLFKRIDEVVKTPLADPLKWPLRGAIVDS
jgi:hypothetical protein